MLDNIFTFSEDDIRTKVVYEWLKDCGLEKSDILIEHTIKFKLGRSNKTINSRTDVLVKNTAGQNLFIIEVKRPDHVLKDQDKWQALSYARALAQGGIAPFTILTNGKDTLIYDSITGEKIEGNIVPANHHYVQNSFRVTGDAIKAKSEALEYLISLSADNLLSFCNAQVQYRMGLLKSDDLFSGKKYIPQLYIKRKTARQDLDNKLINKSRQSQVVLIVGQPQHGKTCFLCNTVEDYLDKQIPVLFYPAISLRKGLLSEIQEDFEWNFHSSSSPSQVISKLQRITEQTGKNILIFVDGWNEMVEDALQLNNECQRLKQTNIQVIISTTSPSLLNLLQDQAGNLSYIAEETKLNISTIHHLTSKQLKNTKELNIVQITTFDSEEFTKGKKIHEGAYNTQFAEKNNLPQDPFYLRLAAENYANDYVPAFATRTELIRKSLIRKAYRRGVQEVELFTNLQEIGKIITEKDSPISCMDLPYKLKSDFTLKKWVESAILIQLYKTEIPEIDFYYTHDKDYCISILALELDKQFLHLEKKIFYDNLLLLTKTESGCNSLRWFLSCPEYTYILEEVFKLVVSAEVNDHKILKILSDSILNQVNYNKNLSFNWLDIYIANIIELQTNRKEFNNNLCDLIYSFLISLDNDKEKEKYRFWMRLLVKYENQDWQGISVNDTLVANYYGKENFRSFDVEDLFTTLDIELFESFILDDDIEIACNAAKYLTSASYSYMHERMPYFIRHYKKEKRSGIEQILEIPCRLILQELNECYYGYMGCPGLFTYRTKGDDDIVKEFYNQKKLWRPVLTILDSKSQLYSSIIHLLNELSEYVDDDKIDLNLPHTDNNQLELGFQENLFE